MAIVHPSYEKMPPVAVAKALLREQGLVTKMERELKAKKDGIAPIRKAMLKKFRQNQLIEMDGKVYRLNQYGQLEPVLITKL